MSTVLVILAAFVINALFLYSKASYGFEGGLLWKAFSSGFLVSVAVASVYLIKKQHKISIWPRRRGLHGFTGWRKLILLAAFFFLMIFVSATVDELQQKYFGGYQFDGKLAEQIVEEEGNQVILGIEFDKNTSILIANTEKLTRTALTALTEEVFYRWFVFGALLLVSTPSISVLFSSLLFGLVHIFSPLGYSEDLATILLTAIPAVVTGFFLSFVYWRCGLLWAIGFHFIANIFPEFRGSPWIDYLIYPILFCVPIAAVLLLKRFVSGKAL